MPPSSLSVGTDLEAKGKHVGDIRLRWSDNSNPLGYHPIPLISLKGNDGPTLLVIGGTHGDEFEGPAAILRLVNRLDPRSLEGQLLLIPALNAPALHRSSRVSPLDGANLNRSFPGDHQGSPTAMIAHFIEAELLPTVDAVIDLHSGGKASFFAPSTLATKTADKKLRTANLELAKAFGLPVIWELGEHNDHRSVNSAAERVGVPMIATELGGGGGVDPQITDQAEAGLLRSLGHLGIFGDPPSKIKFRKVSINSPQDSIYAPGEGVFDRHICAGQWVEAGMLAGQFHFLSEPERPSVDLIFDTPGFVLAHGCRGYVKRGELLALLTQEVS